MSKASKLEIKRYPIKEMKIKMRDLYDMYKEGTLKLNPEYQRSYVWEKIRNKREKLIDSLLREFDIGKIFLREVKKIDKGKVITTYECLDGQQRLRSIFDFMDDNYHTSKMITKELGEPKKFTKLDPKYQMNIAGIWVYPVVVESDDDEIISDIFLRLQEGVPLRGPEKLNAEKGVMRNTVVELSKHKFFEKTDINPYRFAYRYLVAQIMRLEEQRVTETLNLVNIGYKELVNMYQLYKDAREKNKVSRLAQKIKSNLNFLNKALSQDADWIWSKGDMISIYLLTSYMRDKYAVSGEKKRFKDFIMHFLEKIENIQTSDSRTEENASYYDYKIKRRGATTSGSTIKERFEVMLQEFLKFVPDLELKDDKRLFDWGQKLAIYNRQHGKCKGCGKPLQSIKDAEFHHKTPWNEGGKTTVGNGEMYHHECHPR